MAKNRWCLHRTIAREREREKKRVFVCLFCTGAERGSLNLRNHWMLYIISRSSSWETESKSRMVAVRWKEASASRFCVFL